MVVIGGDEREDIRRRLKDDRYWPTSKVAAPASERLAACAFGWLDYFVQTHVATEAILKSNRLRCLLCAWYYPGLSFGELKDIPRWRRYARTFYTRDSSNRERAPCHGTGDLQLVSKERIVCWPRRRDCESYPAMSVSRLLVVHWNQPEACARTVRAFLAQNVPLEITVLDNDSSAELFQQLELILDSDANIVRLDNNKGWGGALNVALRHWLHSETSSFCFISAHDAMPESDCLPLLLRAAENDARIGIACPQYPEPIITRFSRWHGVQPERVLPRERGVSQEIDVPHGTLMLVRRKCLQEIGIFDQRYFAYGDEHELGARAVRNGWKVVMVWGAIVVNPVTSTEMLAQLPVRA